MGLKQKRFGMRRGTTGLKHLFDKNYKVAEDKMDSGSGGSDGGGGGLLSAGGGQWSAGGGRQCCGAKGTIDGCGLMT